MPSSDLLFESNQPSWHRTERALHLLSSAALIATELKPEPRTRRLPNIIIMKSKLMNFDQPISPSAHSIGSRNRSRPPASIIIKNVHRTRAPTITEYHFRHFGVPEIHCAAYI